MTLTLTLTLDACFFFQLVRPTNVYDRRNMILIDLPIILVNIVVTFNKLINGMCCRARERSALARTTVAVSVRK